MSEAELAQLVSDGLDSLTAEARQAFETELRQRGLTVAALEEHYPPEPLPAVRGRSNDGYLHAGWFALKEFRLERRSQYWPVVTGTVRDTFHTKPVYKGVVRAEISYQYAVDAKPYTGTTIRDFIMTSSADLMVQKYAIGDQIEVRFDPGDPSTSYVSSGVGYIGSAVIGISGLLIWTLIAFIVISLFLGRHSTN